MRVVYETVEDCKRCPYHRDRVCTKLGKYLFDICMETDCPLPYLEVVERFTRYIGKDKSLNVHGNCKNWKRWEYNNAIKTDLGICEACDVLKFCHANGEGCEEFDEV